MGPWASAVIAAAAVVGVFFAVMGFRGLVQALDFSSGECIGCGRITLLPLSPDSHRCARCHFAGFSVMHPFAHRPHLRH